MMITKEYEKVDKITEISEAVRLHYLNEDKFNTNLISIVWTIPAKRETATLTALIARRLSGSGKTETERYWKKNCRKCTVRYLIHL